MEYVGLGSIDKNILDKIISNIEFKDKTIKTIIDIAALVSKFDDRSFNDFIIKLDSFQRDLLARILYFTGKWLTLERIGLIYQDFVMESYWPIILAINTDNYRETGRILAIRGIPLCDGLQSNLEIRGWMLRYFSIKGEKDKVESLMSDYKIDELLSNDLHLFTDGILSVLYNYAGIKIHNRDLDEAFSILELLKNESIRREHKFWLAQYYSSMANYYFYRREIQKSFDCLRRTIKIYEELTNIVGLVKVYNNIGAFYRVINEYELALENLEKAKSLSQSKEVPKSLVEGVNINIADILVLKGDYVTAETLYKNYLEKREKCGDYSKVSHALNRLGIIKQDTGQFSEAYENFKRGYSLSQKIGDLVKQAGFANNTGRVSFQLGNYDEALKSFDEAILLFTKLGNMTEVARVHSNVSYIYFNKGEFEKAKEEANISLKLFSDVNDLRGKSYASFSLVEILLAQGDYLGAKKLCTEANTLAKKLGEISLIAYGLGKYGEVLFYLLDNNTTFYLNKAIEYYEKYELLNNSLAEVYFLLMQQKWYDNNYSGMLDLLDRLKNLQTHCKARKIKYYIQYGSFLLNFVKELTSSNFMRDLELFTQETLDKEFFQLFILGTILKIQVQLKNRYLKNIYSYIEEMKRIAMNKRMKPLIGQCNYLLALLYYYHFDFEKALQVLIKNKDFCQKNRLIRIFNISKQLEITVREDMVNFKAIYGVIDEDKTVVLREKVTKLSENLIQAFLNNELKIYIPDRQTKPF